MPTNLELKAVIPSVVSAARTARTLHARRIGNLYQRDTYYRVPRGRLKLREINGNRFELIYYRRPDTRASRYSDYVIVNFSSAVAAKRLCSLLFGKLVIVRKHRALYLYRNARIHIDRVVGLGSFIEFEVLVTKGKPQAQTLLQTLIKRFNIQRRSIVGFSYSDLLLRKKRKS